MNELTESCTELQVKLSDTEQKISKLQEELTTERNKLAEEIQLIQEHSEKNKVSYSMCSISVFKARCSSTVNVWRLVKGAVVMYSIRDSCFQISKNLMFSSEIE